MSKSHKKGDPRFPTGSSQQGGATSMSSKQSKKAEAQKRKHWSMRSQETLISRNRDGHFCLNVEGGAEHGLFTFVGDIRQDRIHYQRGKVHPGDLILAVNHKRVPGMIKKDVIALIKRSSDPVSLISVRQNATITKDIRQYLTTRFTKNSVDSELQHQIRENLHMRVVPCTTRPAQEGERHGIDYNFITVDEFKQKEKAGELLESGVYDGNYYGTPRPPADPPSNPNFQAYSRSPASTGYSKEGVIASARGPPKGPGPNWGSLPTSIPQNLGPLPANWEIAYTENNEKYFIDHNTGTTHWLDPRLARYLKHSILECGENELPYGWEKVNDPVYGTYFIDHINRVTQYDNPIVEAKRKYAGAQLPHANHEPPPPPVREPPPSFQSTAAMEKHREAEAAALWPDAGLRDYGDNYPYPYPTPPHEQDLEGDLQGEVVTVVLTKTTQGFGFTIIGGDRPGELLQIKNIVEGSVADRDGRLMVGDVLVRINGISVLTYSHRKVVDLFQSLRLGSDVEVEVRRGYPLPNGRMNNENFEAYPPNQAGYGEPPVQMPGGGMSETVMVNIIKGPLGFGFSLGESATGPVVKLIMDHPRCAQLREGDVILEVNNENVQTYSHPDLVNVLKRCSKGNQASFLVFRHIENEELPSYPDDGYNPHNYHYSGGGTSGEQPFNEMEVRLMRQVSGFGFRIIGGREEGSQATVGAIVSGGAADLDGRLMVGDEITHINHHSVVDASHRDVISLMGQAAALGEVVLRIQRKTPMLDTLSPTSGVSRGQQSFDHIKQDLGAVSTLSGNFDSNVGRSQDGLGGSKEELQQGDIPQGMRELVIQRPNEQTSFGFVLQSNTLRPGCIICRLIPESPADRCAQLYIYDELLAVNDQDVSNMDHGDIVALIKASSTQIALTVQQPEDLDKILRQGPISEQQPQFQPPPPLIGSQENHVQQQEYQDGPGKGYQDGPGKGYQDGPGKGYQDGPGNYPDGMRGYQDGPPAGFPSGGYQDYPGGVASGGGGGGAVDDELPQISANLSDIASDEEEFHSIEINRSGGGFGFSIRGGAEYNSPLCVLRIADGGAAEKDGRLRVGDELLEINGNTTEGMLHSDAITIIKHGGNSVKLTIRRILDEQFIGSGQYKLGGVGQEEVVFSPTASQAKDRYTQDYMNSLNRRSSSHEPRSPNE